MDGLQLTDVFENSCGNIYARKWYYSFLCSSLPGYTWKAALKVTNIKLDFLRDKHMLLVLQINIRGRISFVKGDRYVESNGKRKKFMH